MRDKKPFLMGSETEFSVAITDTGSRRSPPTEVLAERLMAATRDYCPCLSDATASGGVFLPNGGRFYIDVNAHPEYSTPECSSPEQIVAYDKAGEQLLLRLADMVKSNTRLAITIFKNNLTSVLPDTATFGNHESYLCWVDLQQAAEALIPHLVSRLPYAGSGCLSAHPKGVGFELSQRARHLVRDVGPDTTRDRAIFCTRANKQRDSSSTGWVRAHLIAKDSTLSQLSTYLSFGTTGLLFWILNHGGTVGSDVRLAKPVQALRMVSLDPWLQVRVRLTDGRKLTAVEIQETYYADCERFAQRHDLPPWGAAVMKCWRDVLDRLKHDPLELATHLDAYTKLLILDHSVRRGGATWEQVRETLKRIDEMRQTVPPGFFRAAVMEDAERLTREQRSEFHVWLSQIGAHDSGFLDRMRFVLRLQSLDVKYHELGGMHERWVQEGRLEAGVVGADAIERAIHEAPPGGRAALRAGLVHEYCRQPGWIASWDMVLQRDTETGFDLRDPFGASRIALHPKAASEDFQAETMLRIQQWLSRRIPRRPGQP